MLEIFSTSRRAIILKVAAYLCTQEFQNNRATQKLAKFQAFKREKAPAEPLANAFNEKVFSDVYSTMNTAF